MWFSEKIMKITVYEDGTESWTNILGINFSFLATLFVFSSVFRHAGLFLSKKMFKVAKFQADVTFIFICHRLCIIVVRFFEENLNFHIVRWFCSVCALFENSEKCCIQWILLQLSCKLFEEKCTRFNCLDEKYDWDFL